MSWNVTGRRNVSTDRTHGLPAQRRVVSLTEAFPDRLVVVVATPALYHALAHDVFGRVHEQDELGLYDLDVRVSEMWRVSSGERHLPALTGQLEAEWTSQPMQCTTTLGLVQVMTGTHEMQVSSLRYLPRPLTFASNMSAWSIARGYPSMRNRPRPPLHASASVEPGAKGGGLASVAVMASVSSCRSIVRYTADDTKNHSWEEDRHILAQAPLAGRPCLP